MKISRIIPSIRKKVEICKYYKEQRMLNKFVKLDTTGMDTEAANQLYSAQKTIANYAKANKIKVEISGADRFLYGKDYSGAVSRTGGMFKDKLVLKVYDMSTGNGKWEFISGNPKDTFLYKYKNYNDPIRPAYFVVDNPAEGTQTVRTAEHVYEDNFLRNIYRNIAEFSKSLKK